MANFIELYGGNKNTMAHSGLKAVRAAEAAGLSINEIQQMARSQGISFGSGAQDYFRQKERQQFTNQIATLVFYLCFQSADYTFIWFYTHNVLLMHKYSTICMMELQIKKGTTGNLFY